MFRFTILLLYWLLPIISVQAEQNETPAYLHADQRGGQFWLVGHDNETKAELSAFARSGGTTSRLYISPDRHWLFTTDNYRHRGLQERELFAVRKGTDLVPFNKEGWFSAAVEKYSLRNGVFKKEDVIAPEHEKRRLQFLGDATAQRIFSLTPPDSED
jgi:hypothetical protein